MNKRHIVAVLLAGLMQAWSIAWPFEWGYGSPHGWSQCASLAVMAFMLDRAHTTRQAFALGWLFALAWIGGATWWLYISLHAYGGLAVPLAATAIFLFAAALALYYGAATSLYRGLCTEHTSRAWRVAAFVALWTGAELLRGNLWTGFPWGAGGYAHIEGWAKHWAPWLGVYGLTAISAGLAMAMGGRVATVKHLKPSRISGAIGLALATVLAYMWLDSPLREPTDTHANSLKITLLQGNIPQDLKFGAGVSQALQTYGDALARTDSDLVVTPETAIPLLPSQLPPDYWSGLQARFATGNQAALIGLPLVKAEGQGRAQYANAALGLLPQAERYQYIKHHLVPFGEFVPPLFQWFVQQLNIPLGEFTRGAPVQASLHWKGERIAPNICYEDLFGEELARSFAKTDEAPTLMVNMSNIAWFGNTIAIEQHLNISRMRALELGRPMLRATNTGATAWIDAHGVVQARLPSATQGELTVQVQGVHGAITPYARWVSVWGLWPFGLAIVAVLLPLWKRRRAQRA
jgi:apolipoprotein N-acyltransferase